ncbi:MAG: DMT family transporter [Bacteroidota bacterium]
MKNTSQGLWIAGVIVSLVGAVCFSTKAIFVKLAYRDTDVDAVTLLALRMLFSLPFFTLSAWVYSSKENNVRFTGSEWAYVALIGCLGYYISSLLDFTGLQFVSAGIERLILFIYPTFVLLISSVWFKQKIYPRQWLAVAITYAGLLIAFLSEARIQAGPGFIKGSLLILSCAFTYATYIVGSGKLIPKVGAMKFNSYAMSFASAGVLVHFLLFSEVSLLGLPATVYMYSLLMALLSTVIPSYLVSASIKRLGANNTAIIASVGPVSTILQAYLFLGESITLLQLAGTFLILIGVLIISWRQAAPMAQKESLP